MPGSSTKVAARLGFSSAHCSISRVWHNVISYDVNDKAHFPQSYCHVVHILAYMVNFYKFSMADASGWITRLRFIAFLEPQFHHRLDRDHLSRCHCTISQRESSLNFLFASPFQRIIHQLATTRHVLYDQTWSSLFLLTQRGWYLLGDLFPLLFLLLLSCPGYIEQRYWLVGGAIWIVERILRKVRSRHITYISRVIQHPSNGMELAWNYRSRKKWPPPEPVNNDLIYLPLLAWSLSFPMTPPFTLTG